MVIHNISMDVDKVFMRPKTFFQCVPSTVVIIKNNGKFDAKLLHGCLDISFFFFKSKLWCMNPNHNQSVIFILFIPSIYVRKSTLAVDTRVGHNIE